MGERATKLTESNSSRHLSPIRFAPVAFAARAEGEAVIIRRVYSVPEHITMFGLGAGLAGSTYSMIMAHTGDRGLPCPFRALTGVPCPFCGLTTATVALTHGHWEAAAAANPLAYLVAGLVAGTAPVLALRVAGVANPPRQWSELARKRIRYAVLAVVAMSWVFQLHRYGFL
jgi:Protein of unknown function (DUF2752)